MYTGSLDGILRARIHLTLLPPGLSASQTQSPAGSEPSPLAWLDSRCQGSDEGAPSTGSDKPSSCSVNGVVGDGEGTGELGCDDEGVPGPDVAAFAMILHTGTFNSSYPAKSSSS